ASVRADCAIVLTADVEARPNKLCDMQARSERPDAARLGIEARRRASRLVGCPPFQSAAAHSSAPHLHTLSARALTPPHTSALMHPCHAREESQFRRVRRMHTFRS